jgi:hypothetical protein
MVPRGSDSIRVVFTPFASLDGYRITGGSVTLNAGSLPVIRRRLLRVLLEHHVERGL